MSLETIRTAVDGIDAVLRAAKTDRANLMAMLGRDAQTAYLYDDEVRALTERHEPAMTAAVARAARAVTEYKHQTSEAAKVARRAHAESEETQRVTAALPAYFARWGRAKPETVAAELTKALNDGRRVDGRCLLEVIDSRAEENPVSGAVALVLKAARQEFADEAVVVAENEEHAAEGIQFRFTYAQYAASRTLRDVIERNAAPVAVYGAAWVLEGALAKG